jgi:superfamily II DNA or RNA helicase
MQIHFDLNDVESYKLFLRVKALPKFRVVGHAAEFPDEYAALLGMKAGNQTSIPYDPLPSLFDYQRGTSALAIRKKKFAVFMDPGWGKTLVMHEFARYVLNVLPQSRCVLIVSPLMVIRQTIAEGKRFYGSDFNLEQISAAKLQDWLDVGPSRFGITNYESIREGLQPGRLGALLLDESQMLASHYGKWGGRLIRLGKGIDWKLCLTGTPAPNDRIEYANHAVFLDQFPTVNSFLSKYFINRGETQNRWELKPHALEAFYKSLSHWCFFMSNPATYGYKDNVGIIPPIHVHIHDVPLTPEQRELVGQMGGDMYGTPGGIVSRSKLGQVAKGNYKGRKIPTNKPAFIRSLVDSWPDESTIIWCLFNKEQDLLESFFPEAASIRGDTPQPVREKLIGDFQSGRNRVILTKPKILGLGLNLEIATRQVFSGLQDSYLSYYQGVKRSNRVGSTHPLNVHLPVTQVEYPMIESVLRKADRVQADTEIQERLFKENGYGVVV